MAPTPTRFKNRIANTIMNLSILSHVKVEWDDNKNLIQVTNDRAYAPDFNFKYSETYNVYHLYILTKGRGDGDKVVKGYTIAVVDSGMAAVRMVNVISELYRHRPGQRSVEGTCAE